MKKYVIFALTIATGIIIGFQVNTLISGGNIYTDIKKFNSVLQKTYRNYVEEVDSQDLVENAIRGMLNDLDVHSVYIDQDQMKKVTENFQGSFEGIGIEFNIIDDTLIVVSPISGGASEALGIMSNDKIVNIDGESVIGISMEEVPKKLKGPKGSKVSIDIMRGNNPKLLHFDITRSKIPIYSVSSKFIIDNTDIGVIEVNRFAHTTHSEVKQALDELKAQGMKKLILDLRYNPGGLLDEAFELVDEFIKNDTIVYTIGRLEDANEAFIGRRGHAYEDLPVIVLVNSGSASASEIVSGAIQDLDRGLIVGETSYGKGLVQRQYPLLDGSAFRLTIAKYYTPSGRCIQRPYKDKEKYRNLVGRFELEEGSYIKNGYEKILEQVDKLNKTAPEGQKINVDSLPIYYTRSGRVVLGGGGITPDVIIKPDTITDLSVNIRMKNLFFLFVKDYMLSSKGKKLKNQYINDFASYSMNFHTDDKIMNKFIKMAKANAVEWVEKDYKIDEEFLRNTIKAYIAQSIWNRTKSMQIQYAIDNQVLEAIELFPEAIKLAKLK